jgi:hypothetical protein
MKKLRRAHRVALRKFQPRIEWLESRVTPAAFVVTNLNDLGTGSLRQAILDANAAPGADTIDFSIPGTIQLTTDALPALTDSVTLDGTSAPGFAGTPLVEIDANNFGGLTFNPGSANSTIKSLSIVNANGPGVSLNDSGIVVQGNYIGLLPDGATVGGNSGDGIVINPTSTDNLIGGSAALERNFISGNGGNGITVTGSTRNQIIANFIGTDVTGMVRLGNLGDGIHLASGASSNVIGGVTPENVNGVVNLQDGNLISANQGNGITMTDLSRTNFVAGNFIGTTVTGDVGLGNGQDGIAILNQSNDNVIEGTVVDKPPFIYYNVICDNGGNGIRVSDSDNTVIHANYLGLGADDSTGLGNALDGTLIEGSSRNTQNGGIIPLGNVSADNGQNGLEIRDTASDTLTFNLFSGVPSFTNTNTVGNKGDGALISSTGSGNVIQTSVISANLKNGIELTSGATDVEITECLIGTNTSGMNAIANLQDGVKIDGANNILLGGFQQTVSPHNTISGNGGHGVDIIGGAHDIRIIGSFIGANSDGLAAIPNQGEGIFVGGGASSISIGGTDPSFTNFIGGNAGNGIELKEGASNIQIVGNQIGTAQASPLALPNQQNGILIDGSLAAITAVSITSNTIANSILAGVVVGRNTADSSAGVTLSQNSISGNGGLGIDLADDGVTPNDLQDPDVGPNLLQNYPVLQSAATSGQVSTAAGSINSLPNQQFRIEFFATPQADPSGFGQGSTYLGSTVVTTNNLGDGSFAVTDLGGTTVGFVMTATATQLATGNTSEFSKALAITAAPATITGSVFNDYNANGAQDAGEPPLAGQTFYLDLNNNSQLDTGEPVGVSDDTGNFTITTSATGTFPVRQAFADGNRLTTPPTGSLSVAVSTGAFVSAGTWGTVPFSTTDPVFIASPLFPPGAADLNTAFLNGVYHNLLNRAPDPTGLNSWLAQLQSGVSRSSVVTQITNSQEHRTLQIDSYYETYLGRAADQAGLNSWLLSFAAGETETEVVAGFLNSGEYQTLHASNDDFVASLYNSILSRQADQAGEAAWLKLIDQGVPRSQVIDAFLRSTESQLRSIQSFYFAYLQRGPDPLGLQNWLDSLKGGVPLDTIATDFLTSQEYLTNAQNSVS